MRLSKQFQSKSSEPRTSVRADFPDIKTASRHTRTEFALNAIIFATLVATTGGCRPQPPPQTTATVPSPDTSTAQPAVVQKINDARQAVESSPESAEQWGKLGMVLLAHGHNREAVPAFEEARKRAPDDYRWPHLVSMAYPKSETVAIESALQDAVRINPKFSPSRLALAEHLIRNGQPDAAAEQYTAVLETNPKNPHALLGLGQLNLQKGKIKKAYEVLQKARVAAPAYKEVYAALSRACRRLKRTEEAATLAERAKALTPRSHTSDDPLIHAYQAEAVDASTLSQRGTDLVAIGQSEQGIALLRRAAQIDPETVSILRALGAGLTRAGRLDEALPVLENARRLAPDRPRVLIDLGVAMTQLNRLDEALEIFERIRTIDPRHAAAWYNTGTVLARQSRLTDAIDAFENYVTLNPGDPKTHLNLAALHDALNQPLEAIRQCEQAIKYEPHRLDGYTQLARLHVKLNQWPEAKQALQQAAERMPDNPAIADLLDQLAAARTAAQSAQNPPAANNNANRADHPDRR